MDTRYYRGHAIFPAFRSLVMVKDPNGTVVNNDDGVPATFGSPAQARVLIDYRLS